MRKVSTAETEGPKRAHLHANRSNLALAVHTRCKITPVGAEVGYEIVLRDATHFIERSKYLLEGPLRSTKQAFVTAVRALSRVRKGSRRYPRVLQKSKGYRLTCR